MTPGNLTSADFRRILLAISDEIIKAEPRLNALDSAGGDGDHGITMRLGFDAVKQRLRELPNETSFGQSLLESAQAFMNATGGAIGIILAKMFMGGAAALRGATELGAPELQAMLAGMETSIAKAGKVKVGDKTILDGVHAASDAATAAAQAGQPFPEALQAAAIAATAAAHDTANMVCRIGRASRLGERTLGHPDPGAVSFSIIMETFLRAVAER